MAMPDMETMPFTLKGLALLVGLGAAVIGGILTVNTAISDLSQRITVVEGRTAQNTLDIERQRAEQAELARVLNKMSEQIAAIKATLDALYRERSRL